MMVYYVIFKIDFIWVFVLVIIRKFFMINFVCFYFFLVSFVIKIFLIKKYGILNVVWYSLDMMFFVMRYVGFVIYMG